MRSDRKDIDIVSERMSERFRLKKKVNLILSILIFELGVIPLYIMFAVKDGIYAFRWLTINSTIFVMATSLVFISVNVYEYVTQREMTSVPVYLIRLSGAVLEFVIMTVVAIGYFLGDASLFDEWDEVVTHLIIPILVVTSFVINDAPIGKISPAKKLLCTAFMTVYGAVILTLFISGALPMDLIPYSFLDWRVLPVWKIVGTVVLIYVIAYLTATALNRLNRRVSWLWFRKVGSGVMWWNL